MSCGGPNRSKASRSIPAASILVDRPAAARNDAAMMLIEARVAPSRIHGLGLFAAQFIPRGTPVWRFVPGFDREFTPAEVMSLPALAQAHLRWFGFVNGASGSVALSGDHACFMNHSGNPNTGAADTEPLVTTVARRDIAAGEELTCDYFAFDADASRKLGTAAEPGLGAG